VFVLAGGPKPCPNLQSLTNALVVDLDEGDLIRPPKAVLRCGQFRVFPNGAVERNATCINSIWYPEDLSCGKFSHLGEFVSFLVSSTLNSLT
jgi:hypothetical protein